MLALALVLTAVPPSLDEALVAIAPPGSRVEVESWSAPPCKATRFEPRPLEGSGRVAVRAIGPGCEVWGWASVRLFTTQAIVERSVEAGARVDDAIRLEERLWTKGMSAAPRLEGAVAARRLSPGVLLRDTDLRFGPPPGTQVPVRIVLDAISIDQRGSVVACGQRQVCAVLPTGKRVTGTMQDGVLIATLGGVR